MLYLKVDRAFFAKVSPGGMYEVEFGTPAEAKGSTQDIRDSGNAEAHDHTLVGANWTQSSKQTDCCSLPFSMPSSGSSGKIKDFAVGTNSTPTSRI